MIIVTTFFNLPKYLILESHPHPSYQLKSCMNEYIQWEFVINTDEQNIFDPFDVNQAKGKQKQHFKDNF